MIIASIIISSCVILAALILFALFRKKDRILLRNSNKFVRLIAVLGILTILGFLPFLITGAFSRYQPSGHSEWRDAGNGQEYLFIEADTSYDLGYHEGYRLGKEIAALEILIPLMVPGFSYGFYKSEASKYQEFISVEYKEEMEGIAKGATAKTGIIFSFEDILVQNTFIDTIYGQIYPSYDEPEMEIACSVIGVGNQTEVMVYGQNFDFPRVLTNKGLGEKGLLPGMAFVHTKMSGKAEIFGLRLGAMLSLPTAITSYGVKTFTNIVQTNATGEYKAPITILSRYGLETAKSNLEMAEIIVGDLISPTLSCSFNLLIVDNSSILGFQAYPNNYQLYNATYVGTNRFINTTWNEECFSRGDYSLDRQEYLETQVGDILDSTGEFSEQDLITLLSQRGTEAIPAITREDPGLAQSITLSFMTNTYFGLGNIYDGLGTIPNVFF